jgi:hypothetical protein
MVGGGPVRQPFAGVDFIPQSEIYEFSYCVLLLVIYDKSVMKKVAP